jgi:hypothetical protein
LNVRDVRFDASHLAVFLVADLRALENCKGTTRFVSRSYAKALRIAHNATLSIGTDLNGYFNHDFVSGFCFATTVLLGMDCSISSLVDVLVLGNAEMGDRIAPIPHLTALA